MADAPNSAIVAPESTSAVVVSLIQSVNEDATVAAPNSDRPASSYRSMSVTSSAAPQPPSARTSITSLASSAAPHGREVSSAAALVEPHSPSSSVVSLASATPIQPSTMVQASNNGAEQSSSGHLSSSLLVPPSQTVALPSATPIQARALFEDEEARGEGGVASFRLESETPSVGVAGIENDGNNTVRRRHRCSDMCDCTLKNNCITRGFQPQVIVPLPVLRKPVLPRVTDKIIYFTHKYLPGASPFVNPIKLKSNQNQELALTMPKDVIISLVNPQDRPASVRTDSNATPNDLTSPSPFRRSRFDRFGGFFRFLVMGIFSSLLLITLLYNGYSPLVPNGRPETVNYRGRFWSGDILRFQSSKACGPDGLDCRPFSTGETWYGFHCWGGAFAYGYVDPIVRGGFVDDGDDPSKALYTSDSHICFAAIHAGVINEQTGGCFEARLQGPRDSFPAGLPRNGVNPTTFGWFPSSLQVRTVQGGSTCADSRWSSDLVVSIGMVAVIVLWRCNRYWINHLLAQWGFYYAGFNNFRSSGEFWIVANDLMGKELTVIAVCLCLFRYSPEGFCPDARKFPLEALLLFGLPFWIFIHLADFQVALNANFTFTAQSLANLSGGSLGILVALGVVIPILAVLQFRDLYRAGLFRYLIPAAIALAAYFALIALGSGDLKLFSFHFHHFFFGLVLCILGRGQGKYSTVIQAIGLALFIEGIALYDIGGMFDQMRQPNVGYSVSTDLSEIGRGDSLPKRVEDPIITRAEYDFNTNMVSLEWVLPTDFITPWACDDETVDFTPGIVRVTPKSLEEGESVIMTTKQYELTLKNGDTRRRRRVLDEGANRQRRLQFSLDPDRASDDIKTERYSYYLTRNGILYPSPLAYTKVFNSSQLQPFLPNIQSNKTVQMKDLEDSLNPLIFNVVMPGGGPSVRIPIPMPFARLNDTYGFGRDKFQYYLISNETTICDRIKGIYSTLQIMQKERPRKELWWM